MHTTNKKHHNFWSPVSKVQFLPLVSINNNLGVDIMHAPLYTPESNMGQYWFPAFINGAVGNLVEFIHQLHLSWLSKKTPCGRNSVVSITCCDLSGFFIDSRCIPIDSPEMIGDFQAVLKLQPVVSQTQTGSSVTTLWPALPIHCLENYKLQIKATMMSMWSRWYGTCVLLQQQQQQ